MLSSERKAGYWHVGFIVIVFDLASWLTDIEDSKLFLFFSLFLFCTWMVCLHVYHMCGLVPMGATESFRSFGTGVTNVCELPCGCSEANLGPLQEQPVIWTAESCFYPRWACHAFHVHSYFNFTHEVLRDARKFFVISLNLCISYKLIHTLLS